MATDADDDAAFCRSLSKLECHAHLNGSIPDSTLQELIGLKVASSAEQVDPDLVNFKPPTSLDRIDDFFVIFSKAIYRLTDTPHAVAVATKGVLEAFRDDGCMYLELRTTLREALTTGMTYRSYLSAVLTTFDSFAATSPSMLARLIISVNWDHPASEVEKIVDLAIEHRRKDGAGYIVGVDVCGNPTKSEVEPLRKGLQKAREAGMKLTVHFGEIEAQLPLLESHLSLDPDRLGHATFLTPSAKSTIIAKKLPIEICIGSNVACKTVPSVEEHHVGWALENEVPILICSDDMLIFRNPPSKEYATALSIFPGGRRQMLDVLRIGIEATFAGEDEKRWMRERSERSTVQ